MLDEFCDTMGHNGTHCGRRWMLCQTRESLIQLDSWAECDSFSVWVIQGVLWVILGVAQVMRSDTG